MEQAEVLEEARHRQVVLVQGALETRLVFLHLKEIMEETMLAMLDQITAVVEGEVHLL